MSKRSEDAEADRLTSEEFVDLIPHLPFENILEIEFLSTGGWKKLISSVDSGKRLYRCNLCHPILSGQKTVMSHISGKKHLGNMALAKYFYHPEYTFTKAQLEKNVNVSCSIESSAKKRQDQCSASNQTNHVNKMENLKSKDSECKQVVGTSKESLNNSNTSNQYQKKNPPPSSASNRTFTKVQIRKDIFINSQNNNSNIAQKQATSTTKIEVAPVSSVASLTSEPNENQEDDQENHISNKQNHDQVSHTNIKSDGLKKTDSSNDKMETQRATKSHSESKQKEFKNSDDKEPNEMSQNEKKAPNIQTVKSAEIAKNEVNNQIRSPPKHKLEVSNETNDANSPKKIDDGVSKKIKGIEKRTANGGDVSRNLVKNPLAGKGNKISSTEKQICSAEVVTEVKAVEEEVIVIDDYDEENHQIKSSSGNPKQMNLDLKETCEPPVKKPKGELMISEVHSLASLKSTNSVSRPNLVIIPTKSNSYSNNTKKTEKIGTATGTDEPEFAVKSVTESVKNEDFSGLVGVEYVIKIFRNGIAIKYECGLCELVLDSQSMQNHLLGYSHRIKFCEKHFPTAIQQFRQYIFNVPPDEHYKIMIPVLQKLTTAIEQHHGRCLPYDCDERRYNAERHQVLTDVFGRRHASEQRGPTFTHVIDSKEIDDFILRRDSVQLQPHTNKVTFNEGSPLPPHKAHLKPNEDIRRQKQRYEHSQTNDHHNMMSSYRHREKSIKCNEFMQPVFHPSRASEGNTFMDDETHKRMVDNFLKANDRQSSHVHHDKAGSRQASWKGGRQGEHNSLHSQKRSHSPPTTVPTRYRSKKEKNFSMNIWNSYCRLVDNKLKILNEKFQKYKANPECHPSYKDEWLKFWYRRKTELISIGIDYRTYDFQPDWIPFFNNRINELYEESFEELKIKAREELSLPMTNEVLCDPKYFVHMQSDKTQNPSSSDMERFNKLKIPISNPSTRHVKKDKNMESFSVAMQEDLNIVEHLDQKYIDSENNSQPTIIPVLRLLTALEEHLGILGPKILELLSEALHYEKLNHKATDYLLTDETCTVLETAMEKFKGLIIAGILDSSNERAVKKAILKVNELLEYKKNIKDKQHSSISSHSPNISSIHQAFKRNIFSENAHTGISQPQSQSQNINERLKQALQSVSNASDISKLIQLIEEKIAASLKSQGHTDVDRSHLEQLAAVCVLLEKKKREAAGNIENNDLTTYKPIVTQPLSDALQKVAGNLSNHSFQSRYNSNNSNGKMDKISSAMNNRGLASTTTARQSSLMQSSNIPNKSSYIPPSEGNFNNFFNNIMSNMSDKVSMGGHSHFRQQQQQHHQEVSSLSNHQASNVSRSWKNAALTSTAGSEYGERYGLNLPGQDHLRYK